jgi:D-3-phosphoglycerate dehydrogenase
MKKSAFLINVARGGIVNEIDLSKALNENKISGAAIDVFLNEPIEQSNPLLKSKNMLLTPHLGASTVEAKEGVSIEICKQVCEYLAHGKLQNAVNTPISDLNKLTEIKPFLNLAELIGNFQNQLISSESVKKITIHCQGTAKDTKPILLSFLKGLLKPYVPERINYINAETIAKELGIEFLVKYSNVETSYKNLISINTITSINKYRTDGSIFDDKKPRITNVMGYNTEVLPKGMMLLIENIDVPGVIGNVGTLLGNLNVNIGAYLLTREKNLSNAFSIIRIDSKISINDILSISKIPEIIDVKQIEIIDFDN